MHTVGAQWRPHLGARWPMGGQRGDPAAVGNRGRQVEWRGYWARTHGRDHSMQTVSSWDLAKDLKREGV